MALDRRVELGCSVEKLMEFFFGHWWKCEMQAICILSELLNRLTFVLTCRNQLQSIDAMNPPLLYGKDRETR